MDILSGFHDISLAQLALVAAVAFFASLIGGVSGYGTGALMPLVLVPLVGAEPVVPIIAHLGAVHQYQPRRRPSCSLSTGGARRSCSPARLPTCVLGAWGYTHAHRRGRGCS